jgi:hypothetical protein
MPDAVPQLFVLIVPDHPTTAVDTAVWTTPNHDEANRILREWSRGQWAHAAQTGQQIRIVSSWTYPTRADSSPACGDATPPAGPAATDGGRLVARVEVSAHVSMPPVSHAGVAK